MNRLRTFYHFDDIYKQHKETHNINMFEQISGLIIFIIVFVICIPLFMYKIKLYTLLEVYLPNLDLDLSNPKNFARFGSAELYYEKAFEHIQKYYPYDGSKYEKLAFSNSGSILDLYISIIFTCY